MAAIMAGVVGIATFIFKPVQDAIVEPIKDRFKYLCCFTDNVKDLEKEAPKLEDVRSEVQSRVNIAQNNAENVVPRVQTWLNEVSDIQTKKPDIDSEIATTRKGACSIGGCRYSLSKKVKKMADAMQELRQQSDSFTTISHPAPPEAMVPINIGSTIVFDSRKCVEDEIMASLRDEGTNVVGICGMGGVGKTTMAKTIMHGAGKELGCEETVMAVVSQNLDKFKIQVDIAEQLGLTLRTEGIISSNAHKLRTRLSAGPAGTRKCLIVIDDVWEKLDLEALGIPCSNTCKVLITSRNSHTPEAMDVEKLHTVDVLSETEAWKLFKSKAGSCIEQQNVVDVARLIVEECRGLPLALITVGVALKNRVNRAFWDNALKQLKSANPRHVPGVIKDVYQPLMLSYDFLEDDHQKSIFLMCCLFPEDSDIPLESLANMCKGLLHMNEDIKSSRDDTFALVELLKDRFLLLEGKYENNVKMHDVVRDVAIFIAAEEKRIKSNECTWISLNIGERIGAHGGPSLYPNLHLLLIDCEFRDKELEIHNDFFGGMMELKVIMIECRSLQQLPETIGLLKNLRTLVLESCESLESISVVGELSNLEILICRYCSKIESLPVEIGRLSQLRLLELSRCRKLKTIGPGIISNLIELEELIVEEFDAWETKICVEGERKNASLCELEKLVRLTRLTIKIRDSELAAEQLCLSQKLLKFNITIGEWRGFNKYIFYPWEKKLRLESSRDITLAEWIRKCFGNVECLHLKGDGCNAVLKQSVIENIKKLRLCSCSNVKNLVNMPFHQLERLSLERLGELEEICDISNLKNVSSIIITECGKLRGLFSLSSVPESGDCFLQLKKVEIRDCAMMEQVLMWNIEEEEQNQTNIIHIPLLLLFPKLELIDLRYLPRLTSVFKGMIQGIEFPQLDEINIEDCPLLREFVRSGSAAHHHGDDNDSSYFSCDHPHKVKFGKLGVLRITSSACVYPLCLQAPMDSFTGLSTLYVSGLKGVKSLFSFSTTESNFLSQLNSLLISECDSLEQVVLFEEEENQIDIHTITLFPKLKSLFLHNLPWLTSLGEVIENIIFHVPKETLIDNCPLLECCASQPADQNDDFVHLFCKPHHKAEFDRLKSLSITGSWQREEEMSIRSWCPQIPMIDLFAGLHKLKISELKGMESLFPCSIARKMLNIIELDISLCSEMVRVIEDDVDACGRQIETQTATPIRLFPKLKTLYLKFLPKLGNFCEWRRGLELPLLDRMEILKCGMMEGLALGPLITPNLKTMQIDEVKVEAIDVNNILGEKRRDLDRKRKMGNQEECKELISENNSAETKEGHHEIKEGGHSRIESSTSNVSRKRTQPPQRDESDSGEKECPSVAFEF